MAQAGSGHWRCPLQEEEVEEDEDGGGGVGESGKGFYIHVLILAWVVSAHHFLLNLLHHGLSSWRSSFY